MKGLVDDDLQPSASIILDLHNMSIPKSNELLSIQQDMRNKHDHNSPDRNPFRYEQEGKQGNDRSVHAAMNEQRSPMVSLVFGHHSV